jgi:hypothetical protein
MDMSRLACGACKESSSILQLAPSRKSMIPTAYGSPMATMAKSRGKRISPARSRRRKAAIASPSRSVPRTVTPISGGRFIADSALGVAVPFVFYDHLPDVAGSIGNLPATFNIDTGSRSEIDITSPFVAAHQLRERFTKGTSAVTGWGVGGPTRDYVVRLAALQLGTVKVDDIVAGLSAATHGSISNPNYDANVGGGRACGSRPRMAATRSPT